MKNKAVFIHRQYIYIKLKAGKTSLTLEVKLGLSLWKSQTVVMKGREESNGDYLRMFIW